MSLFRIHILPARQGDCLLIEYGDDPKRPNRLLIDAGTTGTYTKRLKPLLKTIPEDQRSFELLIVSHLDSDHIGGSLKLVEERLVEFDDIWFNGYQHLTEEPAFSIKQADRMSRLLIDQKRPWNLAFDGDSVVVPNKGTLPTITLNGGMTLTLVSPGWDQLTKLLPDWNKFLKKEGMDPALPPAEEPEEEPAAFGTRSSYRTSKRSPIPSSKATTHHPTAAVLASLPNSMDEAPCWSEMHLPLC